MSAQTDTPVAENIQAALLARLETLSPERQRQVLDFAEFLSEREEKANGQPTPQAEAKPVHQDRVRHRQPGEDWPDTECARELQWLKENWEQYLGQWVALDGSRLISHGPDGRRVFQDARAAGVRAPFVVQVEDPYKPQMGGW